MKKRSGCFIAFEGGEGSGKSSLIQRLFSLCCDHHIPCVITKEPGGAAIGKSIRELLLHPKAPVSSRCELLLFLADRVQHIDEVIVPALEKNQLVLCDRFHDSTIVYQGIARGLGREYVTELSLQVCNNFVADLTVFLDLSVKMGFERVRQRQGEKKDSIEKESMEFHEKVRRGFVQQSQTQRWPNILLNASEPLEDLAEKVYQKISTLFYHDRKTRNT